MNTWRVILSVIAGFPIAVIVTVVGKLPVGGDLAPISLGLCWSAASLTLAVLSIRKD